MNSIDAILLKDMIISGANNLIKEKNLIDKLNVFPVPDGDTGTNMSLTIESAVKELEKSEVSDISSVGKAITKGSLMGARGNSGVILSQLLRGFAKSIEGKKEINIEDLALALDSAREVAYKAVIKPVEGTILTVVRETAEYAMKTYKNEVDMKIFLEKLIDKSNHSLNNTPELLKALKDANVVDSGGKGFVVFFEGMYMAFIGEPVSIDKDKIQKESLFAEEDIHIFEGELEFGYCTEFMVNTDLVSPDDFKDEIEGFGDSLIVVGDDGLIKVHIHTNNPGEVMEKGIKYGNLDRIKIENMRMQHEERLTQNQSSKEQPKIENVIEKNFGIISVAMGSGISQIMKDFGVDHIIEGGQTMNPSTKDFLEAIEKIDADKIFILPNNSNIIMAANQAKEISEKTIAVIPTKTIPQGFQALMNMSLQGDFLENENSMKESIELVKTGQVTYAVRDTVSNGRDIKKDDIIGIGEKEIVASGSIVSEVTKELLEALIDEDSEIVSLFYGSDVDKKEAEELLETLQDEYSDIDVELYEGGQPLYYYIISVE
ncbi:DAK2 domain fusion protein YloV [Acetoanaerobium pronyense]|uniref:DAK2 domain fusion protein YloV n=1 Tax=Acetoanaerobium pronyense TaxID=1482736 RepID=A0ABS4KFS7_9FIRM|nr:DAK2 domain-containing protein [Acetoanaerobium pronyense]MBP2026622.1 DAK2 domain fusion protein YloV [Acetoanaerobium pronyense]